MTYYEFEEAALNTFNKSVAESITNYKLNHTVKVKVMPLDKILDEKLPANQHIDFMSIDVEGLDEDVIKSNNWSKYRPEILLVESRNTSSIQEATKTSLHLQMANINYCMIAKCVNTLIYKDTSQSIMSK